MKTSTLDLRLPYLTDVWHRKKLIEFFFKYTMLATKVYVGKSKINSAKKVIPSGDWNWDFLTKLTWQMLIEF